MPTDKLRLAWDRIVFFFKSKKNTAMFFVACGFAAVLLAFHEIGHMQVKDAEKSLDGQASLECMLSQPKRDVYKTTTFFSLTCPHCYELERRLSGKTADIVHRHVIWNGQMEEMARFIYAIESVGRRDLILSAEEAVQNNKGVFLYGTKDSWEFFEKHGLDVKLMRAAHESPDADQFIYETRQMQEACKIEPVPLLMRNGEMISPAGAGGYDKAAEKILVVENVVMG